MFRVLFNDWKSLVELKLLIILESVSSIQLVEQIYGFYIIFLPF
jgi:hypothetical protein